jgi:uncharacterized protein YhbP (UPF0306 family)
MDENMTKKTGHLIFETRVMTLAVSGQGLPWSSPVYFVFHGQGFYFFSNENSKHILQSMGGRMVAASIFHDADQIDKIFGFQMAGQVTAVSKQTEYLVVVKKYVAKFGFLKKVFGPQILENRQFFLEKFKSRLYCFTPERICLSDNSKTSGKRQELSPGSFNQILER